ncbi:MAG: hypothetical protein DHS20C14_04610 [Phycisphaeraceae bacterium]|nr:MAG: hypothetical protein DHS20C14_04610 [Phycisphaeraceae bacterium]
MALGVALLGACTAPMTLTDPPADPPGDFGLAVAFVPGARVGTPASDRASAARYILEPDGSLRAATGGGASPQLLPPIVRRVDAPTRAGLWRRALATGVHDPDPEVRVSAPDLYDSLGKPVVLVTIAWGDGRSSAAFDTADPQARALLDELARLAWVAP